MGCLFIIIIYAVCIYFGFTTLGTIGAIIGFLVASFLIAKLNGM